MEKLKINSKKLKENLISERYSIIKMAILGTLLTYLTAQDFRLPLIQEIYAKTTGIALDATYTQTKIQNEYVTTGKQTYEIIRDCTGWKSIYLYLSLFISTTTLKPKKLLMPITKGIALITTLNFLRLYSTILLSEKGIISFEIIHNLVWNSLMIIITILIWHILKEK